jgi:hypothetical protein
MDQKYNGWSNYPSWNVKLWLDNDEFHYRSLAEVIPTIGDEDTDYGFGHVRERVHIIREYVQGYVDDNFETPEVGMLADLYGWALAQVNWHEIAESYATDYPYQGDADID